jgi:hypothetical protein
MRHPNLPDFRDAVPGLDEVFLVLKELVAEVGDNDSDDCWPGLPASLQIVFDTVVRVQRAPPVVPAAEVMEFPLDSLAPLAVDV